VREQDAKQITQAAHENTSKTLTLLVTSEAVQSRKYDAIEFDAKTGAEPTRLIRCTTELLDRRVKSALKIEMIPHAQRKSSLGRKRLESCPADIAQRRFLQTG
jgi:hypothetical protein